MDPGASAALESGSQTSQGARPERGGGDAERPAGLRENRFVSGGPAGWRQGPLSLLYSRADSLVSGIFICGGGAYIFLVVPRLSLLPPPHSAVPACLGAATLSMATRNSSHDPEAKPVILSAKCPLRIKLTFLLLPPSSLTPPPPPPPCPPPGFGTSLLAAGGRGGGGCRGFWRSSVGFF